MSSIGMRILSSSLRDREAYKILKDNVDMKGFTPDIEWLLNLVGAWYDNDDQATKVDSEIFVEQIKGKFANESKCEPLIDTMDEAFALTFSVPNYVELALESKRQAVGNRLASALVASDKDPDSIKDLMDRYAQLLVATVEEAETDIIHNMSVADALSGVLNKEGRIYLAPRPLHEATDGAMPGDSIVIFARPEVGKTATCCTLMAGFAWHELPGIFFGNEEPIPRTAARFQSCVSGMTADEMRENPEKAEALLKRRGYSNVRFIPLTPGTPAEIEKYVQRYGAKWFVVDQLRNLNIPKVDGRTQQLEAAANQIRAIASRNGCVAVSVTQAGDSADGKPRLSQGDVDSSNTGIPGACDLMIGVGMNDDMEQQGIRMINLPKNKLSGKHVHFPVRIHTLLSRLEAM